MDVATVLPAIIACFALASRFCHEQDLVATPNVPGSVKYTWCKV